MRETAVGAGALAPGVHEADFGWLWGLITTKGTKGPGIKDSSVEIMFDGVPPHARVLGDERSKRAIIFVHSTEFELVGCLGHDMLI